jgi:hypothetical protein
MFHFLSKNLRLEKFYFEFSIQKVYFTVQRFCDNSDLVTKVLQVLNRLKTTHLSTRMFCTPLVVQLRVFILLQIHRCVTM